MPDAQSIPPPVERLRALTDKYAWEPHREAHANALRELEEQVTAAEERASRLESQMVREAKNHAAHFDGVVKEKRTAISSLRRLEEQFEVYREALERIEDTEWYGYVGNDRHLPEPGVTPNDIARAALGSNPATEPKP